MNRGGNMTNEEKILQMLTSMNERLTSIEQNQGNMSERLNEQSQILQALQHSLEFANAEIEGLKLTVASSDSVRLLDAKFDILNTRLFQQEAKLSLVK